MGNLNSILNNFLLNAHDSRTEFKIYLNRSWMISHSFWKMCDPIFNILLKYHNGRTDKLLICNIFVNKANPYYLNSEFYLFDEKSLDFKWYLVNMEVSMQRLCGNITSLQLLGWIWGVVKCHLVNMEIWMFPFYEEEPFCHIPIPYKYAHYHFRV